MYSFRSLRSASQKLVKLSADTRSRSLNHLAELLHSNTAALIEASELDYNEHKLQLAPASAARLILTAEKIASIVDGVRQLAQIADPVGQIEARTELDSGLVLERRAVPLGVFGIIFESRADVAPQILSLALRSGNAVVLKGGKETRRINGIYAEIATQITSMESELPTEWFQMHHDRAVVDAMLTAVNDIDLIIPRGSNELVKSIKERSLVPVLSHADGVCHLYVHESADINQAIALIIDSKTQYPAACNALESALIDRSIAPQILPLLLDSAQSSGIELRGCPEFLSFSPGAQLVTGEQWHTEYGENILAVKILRDCSEAIEHINSFGSHHTDAIVAKNPMIIDAFLQEVDSASVFANCSTRFADGFRYGLGAEIGISTGRVHARGPVGIEGLMTYKYQLRGDGHLVATYTGTDARRFIHRRLS